MKEKANCCAKEGVTRHGEVSVALQIEIVMLWKVVQRDKETLQVLSYSCFVSSLYDGT